MIPMSAWSAPAKALLQYIPEPNLGTTSFSTSSYAQTVRDDKGALRLDAGTRLGQLSLYGFVDDYSLLNPYPTSQGGATVPGFNARNDGRAQLYAASLATSIGPDSVNTAHVSYMRNAASVGQPVGGQGVSLASQGFVTGEGTSGIVPQMPGIEGVENVIFNEFTMGTTVTGLFQAENIFDATDDLSRSFGNHLLSLGASFHADQINTHPNVYDNGSFSFTGSETGLDFADFLLGVDSSFTQGDGRNFYNRNHYLGLYAQDNWKATPSLTLNYGAALGCAASLAREVQPAALARSQRAVGGLSNAPQGILFPGDPGVPRTISPTQLHQFCSARGAVLVSHGPWIRRQWNDSSAGGLWRLLQCLRRTLRRNHERKSSLRIHRHNRGADALSGALHRSRNRAKPGTAVSPAACALRSVAVSSDHRRELVEL